MILIYGKWKVGQAVAHLAEFQSISYEIRDDSDAPSSYDAYEMIIPSPGVPPTHPIYATGKVMAELDFAYQFLPRDFQIVSITWTDGKSTTSWMMYNILEKEFSVKKSVYLSGNFDIPFSATVLEILKKWEKRGIIVMEVSSFMSNMIREFRSDYAIFTNFKWDHLNWHKDLGDYLDAKMHIMEHTRRWVIMNKQVMDFARENNLKIDVPQNARIFTQGQTNPIGKDTTDGEDIIISWRKKYKLSETNFSGMHNAMNILSIWVVATLMKICSKRMKIYLWDIHGLPHRLEKIWEKNGITFVEDSKSTSSQSLEAALGSYGTEKNLLLIVWGSDKWDTFVHLASRFRDRVKAMSCIGATKQQFVDIAIQEHISHRATDSMQEAVEWLYSEGSADDVLILSPGCASFGLFRDYLDRANQFRHCIKNLP
jgi:UDP-N-acetylmuramoylalanine--D-glutamate ligase